VRFIVSIPTDNEGESIALLIEEVQRHFQPIAHEMHILVVDDHSPGGERTAFSSAPIDISPNLRKSSRLISSLSQPL
jgi:hypothetical protein